MLWKFENVSQGIEIAQNGFRGDRQFKAFCVLGNSVLYEAYAVFEAEVTGEAMDHIDDAQDPPRNKVCRKTKKALDKASFEIVLELDFVLA